MEIIKTEVVRFSEKEKDALQIVASICTGLMSEATDPNLRKLAKETFENIYSVLEREEHEV